MNNDPGEIDTACLHDWLHFFFWFTFDLTLYSFVFNFFFYIMKKKSLDLFSFFIIYLFSTYSNFFLFFLFYLLLIDFIEFDALFFFIEHADFVLRFEVVDDVGAVFFEVDFAFEGELAHFSFWFGFFFFFFFDEFG